MKTINLKNGLTLTIRNATIDDAAAMIQFGKTVGDETENLTFDGSEFDYTIEQEEKMVQEHNEAPNCLFILGIIDGEIAGMLNFKASHKRKVKHHGVFGISVLKKYWNLGVGRIMIQYLIDWAKEGGIIKKINLSVLEENVNAFHLYKKLGFQVEGKELRASFQGGEFLDAYYMGLLLD